MVFIFFSVWLISLSIIPSGSSFLQIARFHSFFMAEKIYIFTISFLKIFYLFIFRERRKGERERENHQCVGASCVPSIGDLACNPGMCPDWESNQQRFGSWASQHSIHWATPARHFLSLSIHSLIDRHLGCFHGLAFISNAALNMGMRISCKISIIFLCNF